MNTSFNELLIILFGTVFINNFVLAKFLGICPFIGVSKQVETSLGMGGAVIFVMTLAGTVTWFLQAYILDPLGIGYLQTIAFILVIAALVQFVEMFMKKAVPNLYTALGIFLPLITTNCAVLGVAILNVQREYNLIQSVIHSFGAAVGFALALLLLAGLRERLMFSDVPKSLEDTPIAFITAGLLAIAFMGFAGILPA